MGLAFSDETSAADWLMEPGTPWGRLVTYGPQGFEAYGKVTYGPDRRDLDRAREALRVLAGFTTTPEDCCFLVWEGYGDVPLPPGAARVRLPNRDYVLVRGALRDVEDWEDLLGDAAWAPAMVWPADRAWCFASDVDPDWGTVGASRAALAALRVAGV